MRTPSPRGPLLRGCAYVIASVVLVVACGTPESGSTSVATAAAKTAAAATTTAPTAAPAATSAPTAAAAAPAGGRVLLATVPNAPPRAAPSPLPAGVTAPPPPTAPPAKVVAVYSHWDTVTAGPGESKYNVDGSVGCTKTSNFARGMHIVWRMEFVETATGKILQGADMRTAVLKLPNGDEAKLNFGRHGPTADSPWFWTAAWDVPPTHPLGVLDWAVNVVTTGGKEATIKDHMAISAGALDNHVTIVP